MALWLVLVAVALPALLHRGFRRWLSSMTGAVWILAAVAVLSVLGVMIGQNLPEEAYVERYGSALGSFVVRSGLSDVFTSWYFLLFVSALAVSLVSCSASRLLRLARAGGKGRAPRVGLLLLHVSLVVILAGGLITAVAGFRYAPPVYLAAGESMDVDEGGFTVRVDAAVTEFTEDGMVSEYYSDVTVIEDGREVLKHRIEVNDPLIHNGVGLYQHEMLPSATSVKKVVLGVTVRTDEGEQPLRSYVLPFNEEYTLPGTDISLKVLEFLSDFTYDIERRTAELTSVQHRNPAVLVQISQAGSVIDQRWVFADVQTHRDDEGLPCRIYLFDYLPDFDHGLTRLEISRQPGTPLLFIGFIAMSLGMFMVFWRRGEPAGDGSATPSAGKEDADGS